MNSLHLAKGSAIIDFMVGRNSEYSTYKDFTTQEASKKARTLKLFFYKEVVPVMPSEERCDLGIQVRRASVTANISEGYGRYYHQESIHFYRVSMGFEL